MEHAQRVLYTCLYTSLQRGVLILILMEHAQRAVMVQVKNIVEGQVLILILMEHAQRADIDGSDEMSELLES